MTKKSNNTRPIDQRYLPKVAGIDLEQSLNYIDLDMVGEEFIYNHYTGARLPYKQGNRPQIEQVAQSVTANISDDLGKIAALNEYVAKEVLWAGYYQNETGQRLPPDRAFTEEQLIDSGYAWCNEQARILCVLTQAIGYPSRLIITQGHVVTEVLIAGSWLMLDQSFGYAFFMDGKPVRAADVYRNEQCHAYFSPIYKKMCGDIIEALGQELIAKDFAAATRPDPLNVFNDLGYHNNFLL